MPMPLMTSGGGAQALALLNASLNGVAATLAITAFFAIRAGRRELHRGLMLGAFGASALFLVSYLTRIALFGNTPYGGAESLRNVYYVILITHVLLSLFVVGLVPSALYLGLRGRFETHRKVARFALPIWIYVSVTGVVIYNFLY